MYPPFFHHFSWSFDPPALHRKKHGRAIWMKLSCSSTLAERKCLIHQIMGRLHQHFNGISMGKMVISP